VIDGQSRWLHPECASYLARRKGCPGCHP
jgi:hypothetical protein